MTGLCFSPSTPVSSTNKAGRHDITEILLKVALNTIISPFCNGKKVSFEDFNLLVFYYLSASEIWLDIGVAFGPLVGDAFYWGGLWSFYWWWPLVLMWERPTKVITVCDTPPYGHAPTYQI